MCATCDGSFIKSTSLLQVHNKIFAEVEKIASTGGELELRENLNEFLSDDEKDEVILDAKQSSFRSEDHTELYLEFIPKITQILGENNCRFPSSYLANLKINSLH